MNTTDTDEPIGSGPAVGRTGHVWPCTRFYRAADERDACTCTPQPAPDTERDERLRGIQERVNAATEGPWHWQNTTEPYLMAPRTRVVMAFARMGMQGAQPQFRGDDNFLEDAGRANINDFPDARLIAAASEDMRYLLAEVARLDAVVTAHAATIARLHDVGTGVVAHRYEGDCPVGPPFSPTKRDPACPACRALDRGTR